MPVNIFRDYFSDALDGLAYLVFPETCPACMKPLNRGEKCLCTTCRFRLPRTQFYKDDRNPVFKQFWGKVNIEAACAYYHFGKGEKVQNLIHYLKYKGRQDIGEFTGELFGYEIMNTHPYSTVDLIVPVPLHPAKLKIRGYNQSDCFAEGIANAMGVPYNKNVLLRTRATDTQTRKHRYERYENVNRVFSVPSPELIRGKHVLLVDDVITTGSTFIACAEELLSVPGTKVSIGALACA
ncbi:MAG: ComF family protein [Bacteroidetes bacterium]|nr:MAG: ComF family protein [Bacteroidota bacterium]